jgi:hypothetical protein
MDVFLDSAKIRLEHVHLGDWNLLFQASLFAHFENRLQVFIFVQVRHITTIQNVVDVFKLLLLDNLGVDEQERRLLVFTASHHQSLLYVFAPVIHAVSLDDFNLEQFVVRTECCKSGQTLTTRTSHTQ